VGKNIFLTARSLRRIPVFLQPLISTGFSPVPAPELRQSRFNGFALAGPETVETVSWFRLAIHPAEAGC